MKKEGQKGLTGLRSQKHLKKFKGKHKKFCFESWPIEERERKNFLKKLEYWQTHEKLMFLKNFSERFSIDQKLDLIDQNLHSIDPATIEKR